MSTDLVLVNAGRLLDPATGAAAAGRRLLVRHGRIEADLGPGDPRPRGGTTLTIAAESGVRSVEHGSLVDDAGIGAIVANGTWLVADLYDGDWIDEVGRRDGWPAETLAKSNSSGRPPRQG